MDLPCFFFLSLFDGVDGGVQAQAIRAVILFGPFSWHGGDEMHLSKGEIEIRSVLPIIAFIPFPQNKRWQPNQGNRHMQITAINFS